MKFIRIPDRRKPTQAEAKELQSDSLGKTLEEAQADPLKDTLASVKKILSVVEDLDLDKKEITQIKKYCTMIQNKISK